VLIQPEGVIHGILNMKDGSSFAHMYTADMKVPISNVLFHPDCNPYRSPNIDFFKLKQINFEEPRHDIFPSIKLAREVLEEGITAQIALNASNEIAVDLFLNKKIKFLDIFKCIHLSLDLNPPFIPKSIEEIIDLDNFYREKTVELIKHK
jgi:1-deoxy-D-xylulose-5-phosphate reductoisomerase